MLNQFKIYLYYSDRRINREIIILNIKIINDLFTKRYFIFDEQEQNARVIIIFIYFTFVERNEFKAQKT